MERDGEGPAATRLTRAMRLLRLLASRSDPISLSRLAARTGIPKSTTHRSIVALTNEGAVYRTADGVRINPEWPVLTLAGQGAAERRLRRLVTPFLVDLYTRTGLCADLVAWCDGEVRVLCSVFGHGDPAGNELLADRIPAGRSAAGLLFLATEPPYAAADLDVAGRQRIRSTGLAVSAGLRMPGMVGVAALIPAESRPGLALTVGGPAQQVSVESIGGLLRQTAATAAARLRQAARKEVRSGAEAFSRLKAPAPRHLTPRHPGRTASSPCRK